MELRLAGHTELHRLTARRDDDRDRCVNCPVHELHDLAITLAANLLQAFDFDLQAKLDRMLPIFPASSRPVIVRKPG